VIDHATARRKAREKIVREDADRRRLIAGPEQTVLHSGQELPSYVASSPGDRAFRKPIAGATCRAGPYCVGPNLSELLHHRGAKDTRCNASQTDGPPGRSRRKLLRRRASECQSSESIAPQRTSLNFLAIDAVTPERLELWMRFSGHDRLLRISDVFRFPGYRPGKNGDFERIPDGCKIG
jgi:hypothetical protein